MINVKQVADWQLTLNKLDPKSVEHTTVQENVAREIDCMTSAQYSEFLGHCQTLGMSAYGVMKQKEASELVAKFNKEMGYK